MNKLVNGKFTAPACGLIKPGDRGDDENDCDFVCVCVCVMGMRRRRRRRRGGVVREREREKWKAPVIKSLKECERGAHRSKQTLSPDSSLFIYAPRLEPPVPLHSLPRSLLVSPC